jgi:hypothetical protein
MVGFKKLKAVLFVVKCAFLMFQFITASNIFQALGSSPG